MFDLTLFDLARIRYNELLQEAEQARRAKRVQAGGLQSRLLHSLGDYLVSTGQKLKARYQPDAADSSFQWAGRS